MPTDDDLMLAHRLADTADHISLAHFSTAGVRSEAKPDGSPVTAADHEVEWALLDQIRAARPGDGFVGEESGAHGDAARCWVIDPIDGTRHFAAGRPEWSTLIALQDTGAVVTGLVSAPALGRRWWGSLAEGAWTSACTHGLLGVPEPLTVSSTRTLHEATTAIWPLSAWVPQHHLALGTALIAHCAGGGPISDWADTCQGAMLVAAGHVDVFVHLTASAWDLAAAVPIVEQAGGRFSDLHGQPSITSGAAVFTNGHLHQEVLDFIAREKHAQASSAPWPDGRRP